MVDLKEEQKYRRLMRLAQELHIPIPEAFIELEVFDKDGKLLQRHKQRSHSWTRNTYNVLFSYLTAKDLDDVTFEAGKLSIKNTAGVVKSGGGLGIIDSGQTGDNTPSIIGYLSGGGNDNFGILVGSGTNAESFEDYALQTPIAEGAAGGELNHVQADAHVITWTGGTLTLKDELLRYYNNNSGGDVNVNEVALVFNGVEPGLMALNKYCLQSRDKLASTVTVPDTGQLKVTYTIQLVYPA
ncbi:hypothetical protein ES705_29585 [subsurface metagenome]